VLCVSLLVALLLIPTVTSNAQNSKEDPSEIAAIKKLADALVNAGSDKDQAALLEAQPHLIKSGLFTELLLLGDSFTDRADYNKAFAIFSLARRVAEQIHNDKSLGEALNSIGMVYSRQGQHAKSLEAREQALAIFEKLGDKQAISDVLNSIGISYRRQSKYDLAIQYYEKSLALREQIRDLEGMASTLTSMGVAYDGRGDYSQALAHHHRALQLRDSIGDKSVLGSILNNLGTVYSYLGDRVKAIEYYNQALKLAEAGKSTLSQAIYLGNIGTAYNNLGDYRRALEYHHRRLALTAASDDKEGLGTAYNNIGLVYRHQGDYQLALDYYGRSLKLREQIGDRDGIASTLSNIGRTYHLLGDYDRALENGEKALAIREEIKSKNGIGRSLAGIALAYAARKDFDRALTNLDRAVEIHRAGGDRPGVTEALVFRARVSHQRGNDKEALEAAAEAGKLAEEIGDQERLWQARSLAGQSRVVLGDISGAKNDFEAAIRTIETLRGRVSGNEREQQLFFENKVVPYQEMVKLLVGANKPIEALGFAERAKARVLIDVLSGGRTDISKSMTAVELEQEQKLNAELTSLNGQISVEGRKPTPDQTRLIGLRNRLERARFDLDSFRASLYAVHPELKAFRSEGEKLTPELLSQLLPDSQTALLEYADAGEQVYLFTAVRGANPAMPVEIRTFVLPLKPTEIAKRADRFRQAIAARDPIDKEARELYDLLLKPARAVLSEKTSLVIVPGSTFWTLPFQALQSAPNRFVLQDAAIAYAPSLTALAGMKNRIAAPRGVMDSTLLAFGNPAAGEPAAPNDNRALGSLVEAEREVKEISKLYGAARSRMSIGAEATEERAKNEAGKFRILHFATHGVLDDSSPMYSHVVLASPSKESKEDGLMEAWEMMNLDLHADVVVLSACETARGRFGAGEGVIGMSWALFVAGTPTTVASQWKVPSRSTADIMIDFHRNLLGTNHPRKVGMTKARALQQASLNQLRHGPFRHPFYWAGFVLIGDGASVIP
jgi:CHAT domain-containing protein/tetratricopeptide (TPR) repeat protein